MWKNIDLVNDVGAPAVVTAINIGTRASTMTVFGQQVSEIMPYVLTGGGYLAVAMGWAGNKSTFVKNIAIAAAPLAFEKLYNRMKGTVVTGRAGVSRRVSRYPAPADNANFTEAKLY